MDEPSSHFKQADTVSCPPPSLPRAGYVLCAVLEGRRLLAGGSDAVVSSQ